MRRKLPIFYSALLLTAVNLLLRFVSTSFQVYLSARIGASGIGLLQLVLSVSALSMTAAMAGIRTGSMYLTAEELGKKRPGNIKWVLSGCFTYSLAISILISLAINLSAPWLAQHWVGNGDTVLPIRLFACFLPVICLCGVMTGYFTAANRIGTLAAVEIAEQFISMAVTMAALSLWAGHDPVKACCAVALGGGIGACLTLGCLLLLRFREKSPKSPRIPIRRRLFHIAVPLALADDLKSGINTAENLMVPKRLALYPGAWDPLAAFGTVCGMVFPVLMFPAAIIYALAELLIPELARCAAAGSHSRIQYLVRRGLRFATVYGCLFCGLLFLWAEPLCLRLYNSTDAGTYLRLYAPMIPMLYCDAITDAMTKGLGQQEANVRYNIITSVLDVAVLYLLLPKYGMNGYLFSFFVTHLLNFLLSLRRLMKITGKAFPLKTPALCLGSLFLAVGIAGFVPQGLLQGMCFTILLGCLMFLSGVLKKEDALWVKGLVN